LDKVIVIVGPTAVGKTELSIKIAQTIPAEIISGDSMQIYRGMDIGTGKVTKHEKKGIPHYMIDIKDVGESFSAADFKALTEEYISDIQSRGKVPIIVGGTGLYIESVLYDFKFTNLKRDPEVTTALEKRLKNEGNDVLYKELMEIDELYAKKVHPNNAKRLIRALEIYLTNGLTMSDIERKQTKEPKYDFLLIGLDMERETLYNRINERVDDMLKNGLFDEVTSFFNKQLENTQAMQAIGYKELMPVLKEETTIEQAVELLKRNSRRYAKKQLTYFKNKMDINWYNMNLENRNKTQQKIIQDCLYFLNLH